MPEPYGWTPHTGRASWTASDCKISFASEYVKPADRIKKSGGIVYDTTSLHSYGEFRLQDVSSSYVTGNILVINLTSASQVSKQRTENVESQYTSSSIAPPVRTTENYSTLKFEADGIDPQRIKNALDDAVSQCSAQHNLY